VFLSLVYVYLFVINLLYVMYVVIGNNSIAQLTHSMLCN